MTYEGGLGYMITCTQTMKGLHRKNPISMFLLKKQICVSQRILLILTLTAQEE